jgi:chromosomal replication initiator protein
VFEGNHTQWSPLVFYGPGGSGKTQLVQAMVHQFNERCGRGTALYTTSPAFARDLRTAIASNTVAAWRSRYRGAPLLVFDDLDRMPTKEFIQRELIHLLDARHGAGQRVAVTCRVPVHALPNLHPMLSSRLQSGLCLPLQSLTAETGWDPSPSAPHRMNNESADSPQRELAEIVATTARYFSLKPIALKGHSRKRTVVLARGFAMYLARQWTGKSFLQIGRYFGGRDHTTVLYNYRKIERLVRSDPQFQATIRQLNQILSDKECTWRSR